MEYINKIFLILLLLLLTPLSAFCAELKVIDSQGLTRAVKKVEKIGVVSITLGPTTKADRGQVTVSLVESTGAESPRSKVVHSGESEVSFIKVPAGLWQIQVAPPSRILQRVSIQ
jgi:hypothetical protein